MEAVDERELPRLDFHSSDTLPQFLAYDRYSDQDDSQRDNDYIVFASRQPKISLTSPATSHLQTQMQPLMNRIMKGLQAPKQPMPAHSLAIPPPIQT